MEKDDFTRYKKKYLMCLTTYRILFMAENKQFKV